MSPTSLSTQNYETASQGISSMSFYETATLQPESPPNLNALEEDLAGEEGSTFLSNIL